MVFDEFRKMVQHFADVEMVVEQLDDLGDWSLLHQLQNKKREGKSKIEIFL